MADIDPAIMKKFEAFYNHYCPDDLPILHVVLTSYKGREDALLEKLVGKYGPWPVEGVPEALPSTGPSVVSNKSIADKSPSVHLSAVSKKSSPSSVTSKSTVKSNSSKISKKSSKAPPTPASVHSQQPVAVPSEPAAPPPVSSKQGSVTAESIKSMRSNHSKSSQQVQKQPSIVSHQTDMTRKASNHSIEGVPMAVSRQASIQQSTHSRQPSVLSQQRPPSIPVSVQPTPIAVPLSPSPEDLVVKRENTQLKSEISALNRKLTAKENELQTAVRSKKNISTSSSDSTKANQREISGLKERLMQAEEMVRMKDRMIMEAKREAQKPQQDDAKVQGLLKAAFEEVTSLREAVVNKDEYISKLESQLAAARQAILAATQTGFESDVKLHHAKTALNTLVDTKSPSKTPSRRTRHASGASAGIQTPPPGHGTVVAATTSPSPYTVPNLNQDWNSPPPLGDTPSPRRDRRLSPARPKKY